MPSCSACSSTPRCSRSRLVEQQLHRHQEEEAAERPPERGVSQRAGEPGAEQGADEEAHRDERGVGQVHLAAPVILEHAEEPDRQQQRRERRAARRVLIELEEQHQTRHDQDRPTDAEQPGEDARREPQQAHQDVRDHRSLLSGVPQPPPPGVSIRSTSPGTSRTAPFAGSGRSLSKFRPIAPSPPPPAPRGAWRRRSVSRLTSQEASASNSRTTPSPPTHRPAPPLPRRNEYRLTRSGLSSSTTSTGVLRVLDIPTWTPEGPGPYGPAPWPPPMVS